MGEVESESPMMLLAGFFDNRIDKFSFLTHINEFQVVAGRLTRNHYAGQRTLN
jgi:hypothetical protein